MEPAPHNVTFIDVSYAWDGSNSENSPLSGTQGPPPPTHTLRNHIHESAGPQAPSCIWQRSSPPVPSRCAAPEPPLFHAPTALPHSGTTPTPNPPLDLAPPCQVQVFTKVERGNITNGVEYCPVGGLTGPTLAAKVLSPRALSPIGLALGFNPLPEEGIVAPGDAPPSPSPPLRGHPCDEVALKPMPPHLLSLHLAWEECFVVQA